MMPFFRVPKLGIVHLKGTCLGKPCAQRLLVEGKEVVCLGYGDFLCDGRNNLNRTGTCDAPLCAAHATQTGPNKHLCPTCRTSALDADGQRSLFTQLVSPS